MYLQEERDVPKYVAELYTVIGKVGEGTYGNVFLAHKKTKDNKILAIKTFKSGKVRNNLSRERDLDIDLGTVSRGIKLYPQSIQFCCSKLRVLKNIGESNQLEVSWLARV